jgi:parvulin-like peptidyl-prolyl isomerase
MTLYVNEEKIENTLIEAEINHLRPNYQQVFKNQPEQEQEKQLAEWARENIIEATLFRQQARKAFPQIAPQEIQNILQQLLQREGQDGPLHQRLQAGAQEQQGLHDEIADQIRHERLQSQIMRTIPQPSQKQIRQYYDQHLADRFTIPEIVHAAHIVKHPNADESKEQQYQQMCEIKEKLDSGVPFEELAEANSDCPDSAGDLGFFARGKMVPTFEEVVFNLKPGSYSDVFETEFGWHIAKVVEKRSPIPCSLEQVREVIVQDLARQAQEKALEQFLDAQKKKAHIEER